jgi:hypothetical protein
MTSNIGAKVQQSQTKPFGFAAGSASFDEEAQRTKDFQAELKKALPPEFINRIDEIIIFNALEKDALINIVDGEMQKVADKLKERNIELTWGNSIKELLIQQGYDKEMGARPMRRAIQKFIEDPIANAIIEDDIDIEDKIHLEYNISAQKLIINGNEVSEKKYSGLKTKYKLFENRENSNYSRKVMKFESFFGAETQPGTKPVTTPQEDPDPEPKKPTKPENPNDPVTVPSINPGPKAEKKFSEMDVARRFEMLKRKESAKRYGK